MVSLHAENNIGINLDDIKMTTTQKQDIFKEFGGSATEFGVNNSGYPNPRITSFGINVTF